MNKKGGGKGPGVDRTQIVTEAEVDIAAQAAGMEKEKQLRRVADEENLKKEERTQLGSKVERNEREG